MATTIQGSNKQATYPGANEHWNKHDCWHMPKEAECGLDVGLEAL